MGNELKKCFTASEDSSVAGGKQIIRTKHEKLEKEKKKSNTPPVEQVTPTEDDNNVACPKKEEKSAPLRPTSHFNPASASSSNNKNTLNNNNNKYSYDIDAKFFQKNCPPRKPLNRNLEHYECRNITGEKDCEEQQQHHHDVHFLRGPDDIQDQRVTVENCKNGARIVISDECDSVQIDECSNCSFFIGPTAGSVFIRNCKNCTIVTLCSQLRLRDCQRCFISLFTATKPVIESSSEIAFSRWNGPEYSDLRRQMAKAKLSVLNNKWWQVHDFTPNSAKPNHVIFGDDDDQEKLKQNFISALHCPALISSLVFKNPASGVTIEDIVDSSEEEEVMLNNQPQTVPRIFSRARTIANSSPAFILFRPGAFETAIKFCLRFSSSSSLSNNCSSRIRYATEMKFQNDQVIKETLEGYLMEKLMKEKDFEAKGKLLQQELSGNVACCVVVEEIEGDEVSFTPEEIQNILLFVEKDTKLVKMLTHTTFLSTQATGGSGFGQAFK